MAVTSRVRLSCSMSETLDGTDLRVTLQGGLLAPEFYPVQIILLYFAFTINQIPARKWKTLPLMNYDIISNLIWHDLEFMIHFPNPVLCWHSCQTQSWAERGFETGARHRSHELNVHYVRVYLANLLQFNHLRGACNISCELEQVFTNVVFS